MVTGSSVVTIVIDLSVVTVVTGLTACLLLIGVNDETAVLCDLSRLQYSITGDTTPSDSDSTVLVLLLCELATSLGCCSSLLLN